MRSLGVLKRFGSVVGLGSRGARLTAPGAVSLDWGDVSGADSYDVQFWDRDLYEYRVLATGANSNGITLTFDGSSATVNGLPDDYAVYWFGVRARNTHGTSAWPAIGIVVTPYQPSEQPSEEEEEEEEESVLPPARPAKPTVASASHNSVTIEWDDPSDDSITGYQILRRNRAIHGNGVFVVILDDTGTADTAHTDSTVAASSKYVYRVKAINSGGLSPRSSYANAQTPAPPAPKTPRSRQRNFQPPDDLDNTDVFLDQELLGYGPHGDPIQPVIAPDGTWHRFTLGDNIWTQYDVDRGELINRDKIGQPKSRGDEDWFRVALQDKQRYTIEIRPDTTGLTDYTIEAKRYPRLRYAYSPGGVRFGYSTDECFTEERHLPDRGTTRLVIFRWCTGGTSSITVDTRGRGGGLYSFYVDASHSMEKTEQDYEIRVTQD